MNHGEGTSCHGTALTDGLALHERRTQPITDLKSPTERDIQMKYELRSGNSGLKLSSIIQSSRLRLKSGPQRPRWPSLSASSCRRRIPTLFSAFLGERTTRGQRGYGAATAMGRGRDTRMGVSPIRKKKPHAGSPRAGTEFAPGYDARFVTCSVT